jgi:hypothetical protein
MKEIQMMLQFWSWHHLEILRRTTKIVSGYFVSGQDSNEVLPEYRFDVKWL